MAECVRNACYDKKTGLLFDSEERRQYSQHSQIWAVLSGVFTGEEAKGALRSSCDLSARGGYAYSYLWFRALEKAGCYELGEGMMEDYYGLLDKHCSTIPEMPYAYSRSECHAWGAVALYEFTTMVHVAWAVADGVFTLSLTVPDTVAPEVTVPAGYAAYRVTLNGKEIPPHHMG